MSREVDIALVNYRPLSNYQPKVGDLIIKHGFFRHTVWFAVVNYIDKTGMLHIIKAGLPKLLFTLTPEQIEKQIEYLQSTVIQKSVGGGYSIMQQEPGSNIPVWYV